MHTPARTQLPEKMLSEEMETLISDCWNADASLRPSFDVIIIRLQIMVKLLLSSRGIRDEEESRYKTLLQPPSQDRENAKLKKHKASVISLCKGIHNALWNCNSGQWDERSAAALVRGDMKITATDAVLNDILKDDKGTKAIRSCGKLMIGNNEDGSEVLPDPLLAQDIVIDVENGAALLTVRFSVSVEKTKKKKEKSSCSFQANKEFGGLLEHALAEQMAELGADASPLTAAVKKGADEGAGAALGKKKKRKLKERKRMRNGMGGKPKKGSIEYTFEQFIKAARFVRYGDGVKVLHPSAKILLFALMMQAQHGDCPEVNQEIGDKATQTQPLELLKRKAWAGQKGKKRKDAMEQYVKTLSEIAPQWKLANLIAGRKSNEGEVDKPRRMMWVIRVDFAGTAAVEEAKGKGQSGDGAPSIILSASTFSSMASTVRATSLCIMQGSNASQAKAWFDNVAASERKRRNVTESGLEEEDDVDDDGNPIPRESREL